MHTAGLVAALAAGTLACATSLPVELFNNSPQTVTVECFDRAEPIAPGESAQFRLPVRGGPFSLVSGGLRLGYTLDSRRLDSGPYRSRWRGTLAAQIEPDHRVLALLRGAERPVDPSELAQPDGFPLRPARVRVIEPSVEAEPPSPSTQTLWARAAFWERKPCYALVPSAEAPR